jgi:hypothetical protein
LVFAVPVLDTTAAVLRRSRLYFEMRRLWSSPPWEGLRVLARADQQHLHHGFLRRGFSQRKAAVVLYLFAGALGALASILPRVPGAVAWLALGAVVLGGWLLARTLGCLEYRRASGDPRMVGSSDTQPAGVVRDEQLPDLIRRAG